VEKKMMIVEFVLVQDAQGQPREGGLEAFRPHQPCQFDVIEAVVVGHVWRANWMKDMPAKKIVKRRREVEKFFLTSKDSM
jgi:hypothetical protein